MIDPLFFLHIILAIADLNWKIPPLQPPTRNLYIIKISILINDNGLIYSYTNKVNEFYFVCVFFHMSFNRIPNICSMLMQSPYIQLVQKKKLENNGLSWKSIVWTGTHLLNTPLQVKSKSTLYLFLNESFLWH